MPLPKPTATFWTHPPGTVVRVRIGLYDHVGMLGDHLINGERTVIAFSARAGGLEELPLSLFGGGRTVTLGDYPGALPPDAVMRRARSMQGQAYSWFTFNCEHFVRYAHGVAMESPQLRQWAFAAGLLGLLGMAARS
jgi:Lecithin retinol acyltransferase